jgi:isochorismate synthase
VSSSAHAQVQSMRHVDLDEPLRTRPTTIESARQFVRAALESAARAEGVLALSVPAPVVAIEAPLRALRKGPTWVFAPGDGAQIAAIGVACEERVRGEDRIAQARAASERMLAGVEHRAHEDALALPVRVMIGLAFASGTASAPPWESFGDGIVALPRWTYAIDGGRASLTLATDRRDPIDRGLALAELDAVFGAIEDGQRARGPMPDIVRVEHLDTARWTREIDAIRESIAAGDADKIVAARRSVVTTRTDLEPLDVLSRLGEARASSTRFLVRAGSATLVGATPEHLFTQRGTRITTEALAGSIATEVERGVEKLLSSDKDREEHRYVVRHLVERLTPLSTRVAHPDAPQVRRLPNVLHLRTPIEAELMRRTHPLDVLAALHPTPAVGGTPPERALAWIARHEPAARGWYGGPIGWVDARGDGEFVVALRCGVIQGARAWLWAGGGIVLGSDAAAEWEETALKMRPMLRALGAAG